MVNVELRRAGLIEFGGIWNIFAQRIVLATDHMLLFFLLRVWERDTLTAAMIWDDGIQTFPTVSLFRLLVL